MQAQSHTTSSIRNSSVISKAVRTSMPDAYTRPGASSTQRGRDNARAPGMYCRGNVSASREHCPHRHVSGIGQRRRPPRGRRGTVSGVAPRRRLRHRNGSAARGQQRGRGPLQQPLQPRLLLMHANRQRRQGCCSTLSEDAQAIPKLLLQSLAAVGIPTSPRTLPRSSFAPPCRTEHVPVPCAGARLRQAGAHLQPCIRTQLRCRSGGVLQRCCEHPLSARVHAGEVESQRAGGCFCALPMAPRQ